jgi:hypothetical protein
MGSQFQRILDFKEWAALVSCITNNTFSYQQC